MAGDDDGSSQKEKKEPTVGTSRFTTDAPGLVVVDDGATIGRGSPDIITIDDGSTIGGGAPDIITIDDGGVIGRPPSAPGAPDIITIDDGGAIGGPPPVTSPGLPPVVDVPSPVVPERRGVDIVNDRLKADPDTNLRIRGVEVDPDAGFDEIKQKILLAIAEINITRALAGEQPVEVDFETLDENLRDFSAESGGIAITLGEDANGKPIGVSLNAKTDAGDTPSVMPVSEEFQQKLRDLDPNGLLTPLHEAGHLINGEDERGADGIYLAHVADLLPDVEKAKEFLKIHADERALQGDESHFVANDILMRMRHDLETDPAGFQARLDALPKGTDGKPLISAIADLESERYVAPSKEHFFDPVGVEYALHYAERRVASAVDEFIDTPEKDRGIDPAPPDHISSDGAVAILRMTMSIEEHALDFEGRDALSKALPELWEKNTEAFEEAQKYMRDNYGVEVPTPPPPTERHEPTPAQAVNQRLKDDPSTRGRVRLVEFDRNDSLGVDDPEGKDALVMEIMHAVQDLAVTRIRQNIQPPLEITQELIDKVTEAAENFDKTKDHATIDLGTDANGKPIAITIINPRGEMVRELDNSVVPLSRSFERKLKRVDEDNLFNMLTETGRDINGGTPLTRTHDAKVAAGMMLLDVAENGATDETRRQLRTEADALSLSTDVTEFMQGDVLLRMKHDIKTNADGLRDALDALPKGPDGKPLISEVEKLALRRYVLPSDTDLPNLAKTRDALDFAENRLKGETPQKPVPTNITKDGAVALLRMQLSVEKNGKPPTGGPDNALTDIMPEVWRENPAAFEQAQRYMREEYGMEVQNPLLTPDVTPSLERGADPGVKSRFASKEMTSRDVKTGMVQTADVKTGMVKTADVKTVAQKPVAKKPATMSAGA